MQGPYHGREKYMTNTAEILVLLCFMGMAAVGVAGSSEHGEHTSSNWLAGAGLQGVLGWLCWVFLRSGGEDFHQFLTSIRDFLRPN